MENYENVNLDKDQSNCSVNIRVADRETIWKWSNGEVKSPESINYRTFKPEPDGLFCQRIFGPVRDFECACGKYKHDKDKGVICEHCGVEVTLAQVRRERMGHIELAVPCIHIWFLKSMSRPLALILDITTKNLDRVIYYENYMVTDVGKTPLERKQILTTGEYLMAIDEYGADAFVAKMGGEAILDILDQLDLEHMIVDLQEKLDCIRSKQAKKKLLKRMKLVQGFLNSQTHPSPMVLTMIPVLPADLRPNEPQEDGRFATSDLNDLYRRVINQNNRTKNLMQLETPESIISDERRMLQKSVDALLDNDRGGFVNAESNRILKSLGDRLKGKQGRFRQNLLGKRVDYSGRSVIVIGPELKLHQCGLPMKMALVLFEPFIIRRLKKLGFVRSDQGARVMIERKTPEVWDILEDVTKGHPVLLNRLPTLHRLSIQSFEPVLIEGEAIQLHPLACKAFNADFDGDQVAVHVPLSLEAVLEAKLLLNVTNNIFSPSSGNPILVPIQDIVLGAFYLTMQPRREPISGKRIPLIGSIEEVIVAEANGTLKKHDWIDYANPDYGWETLFGDSCSRVIRTTVGRVIFSEIWSDEFGFLNQTVSIREIERLIEITYKLLGKDLLMESLNRLVTLGFRQATESGLSIGLDDLIFPEDKALFVESAQKEIAKVEDQYRLGSITTVERSNKVIDIWKGATDEISEAVFKGLLCNGGREEVNPVHIMMESGARGNRQQVRQLCGIRGLMAGASGEIIERPILSSFREGLSSLDYFISTSGARKELSNTWLKTPDAGYLTRKLCDVAMDCIITERDDGHRFGIWKEAIHVGELELVSLSERIAGRCSADEIRNPLKQNEVIVRSGDIISCEMAKLLEESGISRVRILSPVTSQIANGFTALEYGEDLNTKSLVGKGTAVGVIAAQSIGEPGTQLTMRTYHAGGVARFSSPRPEIKIRVGGRVSFKGLRLVEIDGAEKLFIVLNKTGSILILDDNERQVEEYNIVAGAVLAVPDEGHIKKGEILARWDPHNIPILSEKSGRIRFSDMITGVTIRKEFDESTGREAYTVTEHKEDLNPQIEIVDEDDILQATYSIPTGAMLSVTEGDKVARGAQLAKTPRQATKTQDITSVLPRVAELFEARRLKEAAEMAKVDGVVSILGIVRRKKCLLVTNEDSGDVEEHLIPHAKYIIVQPGDVVHKGQHLTEGSADPHEILAILGPDAVADYILREVQKAYREEGVEINDKHIEIIISRMLGKVRVSDPRDSAFFWGERVGKYAFMAANEKLIEAGAKPAVGEPILLGITKASLDAESFLSAASFGYTTKVLTEASILGKQDELRGFKGNVILGNLIPAGTGFSSYRRLKIETLGGSPSAPKNSRRQRGKKRTE
jgi:DNA-directed RNA polymerase subunit beta'